MTPGTNMVKRQGSATVSDRAIEGIDHLLRYCGRLTRGERVVVVCDTSTETLGRLMADRVRQVTPHGRLIVIAPLGMHGEEPPQEAEEGMAEANLCLGVTAKSMAHTAARRRASSLGCRYLSLPDYSMELLCSQALRVDYQRQAPVVQAIADALTHGAVAEVSTAAGTSIRLNIRGRQGNACPGFVSAPGELGSPPDIEANVSPVESDSEGTVVVDGSIPHPELGLLTDPIILQVHQGRIVEMHGRSDTVARLRTIFERGRSDKAYILAECGVGLNPLATLTGCMLTDEGSLGTMHFGFGSNATVGGVNMVSFHLDVVFKAPTLRVDEAWILRDGQVVV